MQANSNVLAQAVLLLEDGKVFRGKGWGFPCSLKGELVFNTAHTGYEEVITDPSYSGQIVLFTASHIGNTGITCADAESSNMFSEGFVCKEFSKKPDSHRAFFSLVEYLRKQKKCALSGIDTRALTLHLRESGCLRAILSTDGRSLEALQIELNEFLHSPLPAVIHSSQAAYRGPFLPVGEEVLQRNALKRSIALGHKQRMRVAVIDFGVKKGIVDGLVEVGLEPYFFSPMATVADIEAMRPDGLFLSNGPGDPREVMRISPIRQTLEHFSSRIPTFGICMGHQLLALRYNCTVRKLKFGHHAVNHPVRELLPPFLKSQTSNAFPEKTPQQGYVTSQNHNYVVEAHNVPGIEITHIHLNDGTVAGIRHSSHPAFSVQFHPECNPGPHDAMELFNVFAQMIKLTGNKA